VQIQRNPTRAVRIGSVTIGSQHPIAVQSMTATQTQDIDRTVAQVNALAEAGADVVRIAVDSKQDAQATGERSRKIEGSEEIRGADEHRDEYCAD
jgi:(E)-4-hydroxy-3-methylbut-2-enyl-diphosphate synthase